MPFKATYTYLVFIALLCFIESYSQTTTGNDYTAIDSVAATVIYKDDLKLLSYELTKQYADPLDKTRAIFYWVTQNIAYDYKFVNRNKKIKYPKCKKGKDCDAIHNKWENKYLHEIITGGKAICDGYARLFKRLCDYADIQGSMVHGYTKQEPENVGTMGGLNHAWNVILINGSYYYLDPTWASGSCGKDNRGKLTKFTQEYNNYYWLTPIDRLSRNHFPKDSVWIRNSTYKSAKQKYRNTPYIENSKMPKIEILSPDTGVINAKLCDTIHFKFKYEGDIEQLQTDTNIFRNLNVWKTVNKETVWDEKAFAKQKYTDYKKEGDIYTFDYIVENKNLRYIEIIMDFYLAMKFKVKIVKE